MSEPNDNDSNTYPSASTLLEVIIKEYEVEKKREESINTRSGVILSALFVFLAFILAQFNFDGLKKANINSLLSGLPYYLSITFLIVGLVTITIALFIFIRVISTKEYKAVQINDLISEDMQTSQVDLTQSSLIDHYHKIVSHNSKITSDKAIQYSWGLIFFSVSIALLVIAYIISRILF